MNCCTSCAFRLVVAGARMTWNDAHPVSLPMINGSGCVPDQSAAVRSSLGGIGLSPRQQRGEGFSFVEVLTMCPTGWFVPTSDGPRYMDEVMGSVHVTGVLKDRSGVA